MYGDMIKRQRNKQSQIQQGQQEKYAGLNRGTVFHEAQRTEKEYVKSEIIYGYDLNQTLDILKKVALESGSSASYEFYHACLDRLDILITEQNSVVKKNEVVQILRILSYFRPREYERDD